MVSITLRTKECHRTTSYSFAMSKEEKFDFTEQLDMIIQHAKAYDLVVDDAYAIAEIPCDSKNIRGS